MTTERCACGKRVYLCCTHAKQDARRRKREVKAIRGIEPYRDPVCRAIHLGAKSDHMQRRCERKVA